MARNKRTSHQSNQPTLRVAGLNPTASQNMAPKTLVLESDQKVSSQPLSEKEMSARREYKKVVTGAGGYFNNKNAGAYSSGGYSDSSGGNFYSPQLSTDFLEKPQNLRERRAWYRHFYNANEIVGSAIDLHSTIPLSKIRLQKPKAKNPHLAEYSYRFFTKMCDKIKMLKTLLEMSHEYWLLGNCLDPLSLVRTSIGYSYIKDIQEGDLVLTHTGRYMPVEVVMRRRATNGLEIKPWYSGLSLRLTEEHPLEVYRDGKFSFTEAKNIKSGEYVHMSHTATVKDVESMTFVHNSELIQLTENGYLKKVQATRKRDTEAHRVRSLLLEWLTCLEDPIIATRKELCTKFNCKKCTLDNVVLQLGTEIVEPFHKRLGPKGYQKGSQVQWLPLAETTVTCLKGADYTVCREETFVSPKDIQVDNDLMYLIGYWLGDGTIARDRSREGAWGRALWHITIGKGSEEQALKLTVIMSKILGQTSIPIHTGTDSYNLAVSGNPAFVEWWASNFGETSHGSNKKRIPQWVLELPTHKLEHLLAGILDSDGCISNNGISVGLTAKNLALSIRDISLKCGSFMAITVQPPHKIKNLGRATSEYGREAIILRTIGDATPWYTGSVKYTRKVSEGVSLRFAPSKHVIRVGSSFAVKIRRVSPYSLDEVFNLQVAEDHTYQANLISTHNCFAFAEDHLPYEGLSDDAKEALKFKGKVRSDSLLKDFGITDSDPNYTGITKIIVLPPDQVRVTKIPFADNPLIEYVPDPETKSAIARFEETHGQAFEGLSESSRPKIPESIRTAVSDGGALPLDTDPNTGSFVYHLARKKSQYEVMGVSILERCINTLLIKDKLRQAQTSIASRHMTPIRVVSGEQLSDTDVDDLRMQVDMALMDPDYSIISNYTISWEEYGSNQRLLELTTEYDHQDADLFAGLGVTKEMMTGEASYAGSKISMEILNIQYLLFRDMLQDYIEKHLFEPVARRKGFIETDEYGEEHVIYPKFSFTRMSLKDSDQAFEQAFQLYQKGSLPVDTILEFLGFDPELAEAQLKKDMFTVNDASFNALVQAAYQAAANDLVAKSDLTAKAAEALGLKVVAAPPEGDAAAPAGAGDSAGGLRFASAEMKELSKLMAADPEGIQKVIQFLRTRNGKANTGS